MDDAFITPDKQVAQLRIPPHSIESESSVLGGLLLDNNAWDRVGDVLAEDNFYRHEHKLIFTAIASMINAGKPAKLALTAVMRQLLHVMNILIKNPNFTLA